MTWFQSHWSAMSPFHQEQYHVLFALVDDLKRDVIAHISDNTVEVVEPCLALPRCSMDPRLAAPRASKGFRGAITRIEADIDVPLSEQKDIPRG